MRAAARVSVIICSGATSVGTASARLADDAEPRHALKPACPPWCHLLMKRLQNVFMDRRAPLVGVAASVVP